MLTNKNLDCCISLHTCCIIIINVIEKFQKPKKASSSSSSSEEVQLENDVTPIYAKVDKGKSKMLF